MNFYLTSKIVCSLVQIESLVFFSSLLKTSHEPIKRRLNTDKAARQFRKALADVNWVSVLNRNCALEVYKKYDTHV